MPCRKGMVVLGRKKGSRRPSHEETDAELSQCGVL